MRSDKKLIGHLVHIGRGGLTINIPGAETLKVRRIALKNIRTIKIKKKADPAL